jgi:hypothetical protein
MVCEENLDSRALPIDHPYQKTALGKVSKAEARFLYFRSHTKSRKMAKNSLFLPILARLDN